MSIRKIKVDLAERGYPILLGNEIGEQFGSTLRKNIKNAEHAVIVTVPAVKRRYAPALRRSLRASGIRSSLIEVPDGDATKNLKQVSSLYRSFLDLRVDRSTPVIALGGGMVGDLAGFAASTFLRGVPFVQVPTTVLSMVDASIGGKVGVNLPEGKNLVGSFYQPRFVWIDIEHLKSLPARERAAGLAEVIKAGAIWDEAFFIRLEKSIEEIHQLKAKSLLSVIQRACEIKAEVVAQDERERGLRMLLNFGHTVGHAIESIRGYRGILHGEAVAIGMAYAGRLSEDLELAPHGTAERIVNLASRVGLPTKLPQYDRKAYLEAINVDKKKMRSRIHFVALRRIGEAFTVPLTSREILPASSFRKAG